MTMRFAGVVLAGSLLLAACGLLPPASGELDGSWTLTAGNHHGDALPIPAQAPITMRIDGVEIGGTAACNHYGGEISVSGDRVTIGAMSMTEMACEPAIMEAEAAYMAALADVERWARDDERLTLSGPTVELTYELVPPIADADLVGTTWRLDGLVDGETVSSTMGDDPSILLLGGDGTVSGSTGCRTFDGRYELEDGAVRVTRLTNDDRACPGLESQDEHVLAVIGGGFAYEIEGQRLTLSAGRLGLTYRPGEG